MDPKALVANPRLDLVQQRHVLLPAQVVARRDVRDDVQVLHVLDLLVEGSELVEVCREKAEGVDIPRNVSAGGVIMMSTLWGRNDAHSEIAQARPKPS